MTQPRIQLKSYLPEADSHHHDHHQLVLPLQGSLDMEIEHSGGMVDHKGLAVIQAGSRHAFSGSELNRFLVLDLPCQNALAIERLPRFIKTDDALSQYIRFMEAAVKQQQLSAESTMTALLLEMLVERSDIDTGEDKRIARARRLLESNLADHLSIGDVAREACLSDRQLRALFKSQHGVSPMKYRQVVRLEKAKHWLENQNLSVSFIAQALGFANTASFSQSFSSEFQVSPSQYRRSAKHNRRSE